MKEYLIPTREDQTRALFFPMSACSPGSSTLVLTKIHPYPENNPHNIIFCEGKVLETDVNINMTFGSRQQVDAKSTESRIYDELGKILDRYTPNVVLFLGNRTCDSVINAMNTLNASNDRKMMKSLFDQVHSVARIGNPEQPTLTHVNMLLTKKPRGSQLSQLLENNSFEGESDKSQCLKDVLFQLAYTLLVFEDLGLMHHSLTANNVFVEKLPVPLHFSAKIGGDVVVTRFIKYFILIQDFTNATKVATSDSPAIIKNNYLEERLCKSIGTCNTFRHNMDWFNILRSMSTYDTFIYSEILKIVRSESLLTEEDLRDLLYSPYTFLSDLHGTTKNCKKPAFSRPSVLSSTDSPPATKKPPPVIDYYAKYKDIQKRKAAKKSKLPSRDVPEVALSK
jgi:hypothetical protein